LFFFLESAKTRTSKLNQPTKLLKYTPTNTINTNTTTTTTTTSGSAATCRIPAQPSLLKKQASTITTTPSHQIKSLKPSTTIKTIVPSKITNAKANNIIIDSKLNYEPIKLQTLPVNSLKSSSSVSTTCSDTKSPIQTSSVPSVNIKSAIPSFGIVKQQITSLNNVKPVKTAPMIANSNLQKPSSGIVLKRAITTAKPTAPTFIHNVTANSK